MTSWNHAIEGAATRKALTALVNEYLASWTPAEISHLPEACRPTRMQGLEDILYWDGVLAEAYCAGAVHGPDNETYGRILAFIADAAERARAVALLDPVVPGRHEAKPIGAGVEPGRNSPVQSP